MSEFIRTKYRKPMQGNNRKPSKPSEIKPTDGHRCPECGNKLTKKMTLELHKELEPNCGEEQ